MDTPARTNQATEIGSALRALLRAGRHLQAALASRLAIGETDLAAMDELVDGDASLGPVDLADRLGIRSASVTILVDRLEEAGYVRRERHPSDRRRIVLHTTGAARGDIHAAMAPVMAGIQRLTEDMDDEQIRNLAAFLRAAATELTTYATDPESGSPRVGRPHTPGR